MMKAEQKLRLYKPEFLVLWMKGLHCGDDPKMFSGLIREYFTEIFHDDCVVFFFDDITQLSGCTLSLKQWNLFQHSLLFWDWTL